MIVKIKTVTQCSEMKLGSIYGVSHLILVSLYIILQIFSTDPPFVVDSHISRLWICASAFLAGGLLHKSSYLRLIPT